MLQLLHFPATQLFLELAEVEELVEVALLPGLLPGFLGVNPLEKAPVAVHETKASVHKSVADLSFLPAHLLCHLFQKFLLACLLCFPCFLTRLLPNLLDLLQKFLARLLTCFFGPPVEVPPPKIAPISAQDHAAAAQMGAAAPSRLLARLLAVLLAFLEFLEYFHKFLVKIFLHLHKLLNDFLFCLGCFLRHLLSPGQSPLG